MRRKCHIRPKFQKIISIRIITKIRTSYKDHIVLKKYCKKLKIEFMSTAFDLKSLELLNKLNIKIFKIPSSELNNLVYLKKLLSLKKR